MRSQKEDGSADVLKLLGNPSVCSLQFHPIAEANLALPMLLQPRSATQSLPKYLENNRSCDPTCLATGCTMM